MLIIMNDFYAYVFKPGNKYVRSGIILLYYSPPHIKLYHLRQVCR